MKKRIYSGEYTRKVGGESIQILKWTLLWICLSYQSAFSDLETSHLSFSNEGISLVKPNEKPKHPTRKTIRTKALGTSGLTGFSIPPSAPPRPSRFVCQDRGEPIGYKIDAFEVPTDLSRDAAIESVHQAFAIWAEQSGTLFHYLGQENFGQAANQYVNADEIIRIQLHDRFHALPTGDLLAFGGLHSRNGGFPEGGHGGRVHDKEFHRTVNGYIIVNNLHDSLTDITLLEEVIGHEIGHVLGLAHSSENPLENDSRLREAAMYFRAHDHGRGLKLQSHDIDAIRQAYPQKHGPPASRSDRFHAAADTSSDSLTISPANLVAVEIMDLDGTTGPMSVQLHSTETSSLYGTFFVEAEAIRFKPNSSIRLPGLPLDNYYDQAVFRVISPNHASPWETIHLVGMSPDQQPVDGIPDRWITEHFVDTGFNSAESDSDEDGCNELCEYLQNTDPLNNASRFEVRLESSTRLVAEETGQWILRLRANRPAHRSFRIPLRLEGTAVHGQDFVMPGSIPGLYLARGEDLVEVAIRIIDDALIEGSEFVRIQLENTPFAGFVDAEPIIVEMVDAEPVPLYAFEKDRHIFEEKENIVQEPVITVHRSGNLDIASAVWVRLQGANGNTETNAEDFGQERYLVEFAAHETTRSVTLQIHDDSIFERTEVFDAVFDEFLPGGRAADVRNKTIIEIVDNEEPPRVTIETKTVKEGTEPNRLTLTLSHPSAFPTTVNLVPGNDGTANADLDYRRVSADPIVISAGTQTAEVFLDIIDDDVDEDVETMEIVIASVTEGIAGAASAWIEIQDNDPPPTITVQAVADAVPEGSDEAVFLVRLNTISEKEVTFSYRSEEGTASEGLDFQATVGRHSFLPGQTETEIRVVLLDDATDETTEIFWLSFFDVENAVWNTNPALLTLNDDDPQPLISIQDVVADEDSGKMDFILTLSAHSGREITVQYATRSQTANEDQDYFKIAGTAVIPPGHTEWPLSVGLVADWIVEPNETLELQLEFARNAVIQNPRAQGTIHDDDLPDRVAVGSVTYREGDPSAFVEVIRSSVSDEITKVFLQTEAGTALPGTDYQEWSGVIEIPAGDQSVMVPLNLIGDELFEKETSFEVSLSGPVNVEILEKGGTITIHDDDPPPTLHVRSETVSENAGTLRFFAELSAAIGSDLEIVADWVHGTAERDVDVRVNQTSIPLPAGKTEAEIVFEILDDSIHEAEVESVTVNFGMIDLPAVNTSEATGWIKDDEPAPQITISDVQVNEREGEAILTVMLSGPSAFPTRIDYHTQDASATKELDYSPSEGSIFIEPLQSQADIIVSISDDDQPEQSETFHIQWSGENGSGTGLASVTIHDNDHGEFTILSAEKTSETTLTLVWIGDPGTSYDVEMSEDLVEWDSIPHEPLIGTGIATAVEVPFSTTVRGSRFFRLSHIQIP